jgi:hypothetical protein
LKAALHTISAAMSASGNGSAAAAGLPIMLLPTELNLTVVLHPAITYSQQQSEAYPYEMPTNQAPGEN